MNYYAFIPLVAFVVNVFTWTYIYAQKRQSPVNRAYLVFAACLAGWNLMVLAIWLQINDTWLLPMLKMGSIFWLAAGFCFLNFTYTFLDKKKDPIYYFYLIFSLLSVGISISTNLYMEGYIKHYWGVRPRGILYAPITFIVGITPLLYALYLLYQRMRITKDKNIKSQLMLIFQGSSIALFIVTITQIVLPYIVKVDFIHLGSSSTLIQALLIFVAVNKYNFLSIRIEEVADYLFTNIEEGVIIADNDENVIQINGEAKEIFSLSYPGITDMKVSSLFENYDFHMNYKNYETRIGSGEHQKIISLSQAVVKQYDTERGKILIIRDITETKKAERELQGSKTKLENLARELAQANTSLEQKVADRTRSLLRAKEDLDAEKEQLAVTLSSIGDGVITTDTAGHVVLVNKVAAQLTGWSQLEAAGQQLSSVFPIVDEKTREPCEDPVQEALHTDTIVSRLRHSLLRARDHTERIIAESAAPIHAGDGAIIGVVIVFRDMTDRRRIEEELIRADKFESIGVLAGGIAHDFNNILTAILGNVSLAKMYANPEDKVFTRLMNAEKATLQAQNLTQQLLTFSKGETLVRRTASIVDLIKDSIDFSMRGSNVRCDLSVEPDIWPVDIDAGRISQVINNLLINAYQAMPDGGIIDVQVENVERTDDGTDPFFPLKVGEYVRICVKDHGIGISEENLQKIFDPYFTTKQKGTGLGLFTCYSIIKKHEGHIAVESCQGVGTTFQVYIPASHKRVLQAKNTPDVQPAGTGRILIMEDEETIRDVTGEMLSHYGYKVAFAKDGTEAIALYRHAREAGTPFDVAIMDLTIPGGMGGKEAVQKILAIDPHAKAVVASGYANDPIVVEYRQYGFCDRIVKPYKSEELHTILHRILQRR